MKLIKRHFLLSLCVITLLFSGNTARGAMFDFLSSEQKFYLAGIAVTGFVGCPILIDEAFNDEERKGAEWWTVHGTRFALALLFSQWCLDRYRMTSPVSIRDMAKKLNVS